MKKYPGRFARYVIVFLALSSFLMVTPLSAGEAIVHYRTYLRGHREVNGGDPDGSGRADVYIRFGRSQICYELTLENIAFPLTGSHIHSAPAGVNGPVVVGFPVNGGENLADCLDVPRETIQFIASNPAQFYVNVHNAEYPGGAIRGQLRKQDD